jgi:hypothetical protein
LYSLDWLFPYYFTVHEIFAHWLLILLSQISLCTHSFSMGFLVYFILNLIAIKELYLLDMCDNYEPEICNVEKKIINVYVLISGNMCYCIWQVNPFKFWNSFYLKQDYLNPCELNSQLLFPETEFPSILMLGIKLNKQETVPVGSKIEHLLHWGSV